VQTGCAGGGCGCGWPTKSAGQHPRCSTRVLLGRQVPRLVVVLRLACCACLQ
jgi:hypothetical protein